MDDDAPLAPTLLIWEPTFEAGHAVVDAQHQDLVALCNRLAESCADAPAFEAAFAALQALVQAHADTEATLLAAEGGPEFEDTLAEAEEFAYLAAEIATTANFDRLELQRFAAVWCLGHVSATARQLRARVS